MKPKAIETSRLISCLLLSLFVCGCSDNPAPVTEDTDVLSSVTDAETVTDVPETVSDDLPDELDFTGRELRILSSLGYSGPSETFHASILYEASGDILDDAIFERNSAVMERFGITITEEALPYQEALPIIRACVNAGDDVYDLVSLVDRDALTLATEGMIYYMDEVPYIDFSKPYWNKSLNDSMSICGRNILAYSDMVLTSYDFTHILTFNKQLIEELSLESPYDLVDDGRWTLDKFNEYIQLGSADLNGDTVYDKSDRYGFASLAKQIAPCFWIASDCASIVKNNEDVPEFTMENDRMISVLDKAYEMTWGNNYWYCQLEGDWYTGNELFASDQVLFCNSTFGNLFGGTFRDMKTDYGIIPYPKYDEAQDAYYSRVEGGNPYTVPITAGDPEFAGAMIEAMACESHNRVIPTYYETALKAKFTRDEKSVQILDMIMSSRVYDFGDTFFSNILRDGFVAQAFNGGTPITASTIASNRSSVEAAIQKVVDAVEE